MVTDGKTGLNNDAILEEYTRIGLRFENGSALGVDAVAFATGRGDYQDDSRKLLNKELGSRLR